MQWQQWLSLTQSYFLFFSDMRTYLETQPRLGGKVGVGSFSEGVIFKLVPKEDYYPSANVDPSLR